MRKGGGKAKGAGFEREVCKKLSLWISKKKRTDLFWRSAMSGGRATLGRRRGEDLAHQAGDICAVHPEGHVLTNNYYLECKFYRNLEFDRFLFGEGRLFDYWAKACEEALAYKREPMLVAKENFTPIMVLVRPEACLDSEVEGYFGTYIKVPHTEACILVAFDRMLNQPFTSMLRCLV